jgi:hypothetical protein
MMPSSMGWLRSMKRPGMRTVASASATAAESVELNPQVGRLVGDLLDIVGGRIEQTMAQLGECTGGGELVADLRHVPVSRAESCQPYTHKILGSAPVEPGDRPGAAIMLVDINDDAPALGPMHLVHLVPDDCVVQCGP